MSPVERRTTRSTTTAIVVGIAGVVAGIGLVFFVVNLAGRGGEDLQIRIGDDRFEAGSAEGRADSIAEDGPILFPDVAGTTRDIYLQHIGDDVEAGWLAFNAVAPGKARDCFLQWQADTEDFVDCDDDRYPADGGDLPSYPVAVEDGELFVDINAEFREDGDEGTTEEDEGARP